MPETVQRDEAEDVANLNALPREVLLEAIAITAREHKSAWAMLYHHATSFVMGKGLWEECSAYLKAAGAPMPPLWNEAAILETAQQLMRPGETTTAAEAAEGAEKQ